jgi:hypothetical protein
VNYTSYVRNLFANDHHSRIKCAYIPTEQYDFSKFETSNCSTTIIIKNSIIIWQSNLPNQRRRPFEIIEEEADVQDLKVECECRHMSFYTLIEDLPILSDFQEPFIEYVEELPVFKDWPTLTVLFYLVILIISGSMFASGRDSQDYKQLKDLDDKSKSTVSKSDQVSLMTWVFNRRLAIEPYSEQNLKACCQPKDKVRVSTWVLFKVFMTHLHPLFSISGHFDLSLKRFDRMLLFFARTVVVFEICHFTLSSKLLFDIEPDFFFAPEVSGQWAQSDEGQIVIVFLVCLLCLIPLPSCCFNIGRSKHRIKTKIISQGSESEAFTQYLQKTAPQQPIDENSWANSVELEKIQIQDVDKVKVRM